jgi:hypothetical protein
MIVDHALWIGSLFGEKPTDAQHYIDTGEMQPAAKPRGIVITPEIQKHIDQINRDGKLIVPVGGFDNGGT